MGVEIDLNLPEEDVDGVSQDNTNIFKSASFINEDTDFSEMEFHSDDKAYEFYSEYAKQKGFAASKVSCRRSKTSGEWIDTKFACTRYGKKRKSDAINPRPCLKIDCKASLEVKRRYDGKWFVCNFVREHNHDLYPEHIHYFPSNRRINSADKYNINALHSVGVKPSKIFAAMAKQYGGYEKIGFLEKDIRNHLDKERRLALESGDAKAMLELFTRMQEENPNFFYAMDLDEEQRLVNVFWVDAKGREDYKNFGDVISFDTTYITNKYKMPFAPFIGVNNHSQSTLLGCALLADETTCTFVWLMKTWIRAMGGKAPSAILTDQDQAMKAAIAEVFPNARHRFCLWHILRKIPQKLGEVLRKHGNFMGVFNNCIYNSWTVEDFEQKWQNMVEVFELDNNEWIKSLFEDRKFWVPTYMRDAFFAGMSTTQRSESINSFFDKYVNKKTTLKEFVEKYRVALQDREEAATHADFKTLHKEPTLKSPSPFEKQMSVIYTHEIFRKFQLQVLGVSACYPIKEKEESMKNTFKVQDFEKKQDFVVVFDGRKCEVCCVCRLFEYSGFLCRHAIAVLQSSGVFRIPSHYILKRWTKDARNGYTSRHMSKEVDPKKQHFNDLFRKANKLIEEGSLSQESYDIVNHALEKALKQCASINHSLNGTSYDFHSVDKENVNNNVLCDINVLDPRVSNTKGAPKRVKNQNSNGKKYNKKPKKAQANLGLSNDGIESSLPRQEQAHTRNDASDNYKDTHECLQQIDEYETLEGHNGMKVNMDWMEQLIHIREELHVKSGKMSSEVVYL
ncbi:hypothetical protein L3X38_006582 [Prunus dulcis]|uniref:Protein FAR1-RELATED SEQUENCE n=1 Tax=Prunus dulcis TaxID=3755 RepID=A0AAD5F5B4_PRUDU|nr:hypothetical protein L3X38_006582 [Prunus dulcis]